MGRPLQDKVRILVDSWPVLIVKELGALSTDVRRCAMVALSGAVLGRGGFYGLVLDFQHAELLSVVDRELVDAFGRAAGRSCRAVAAVTQTGSGSVSAMLWARALKQNVVLVGSVPEGLRSCCRVLGVAPPAAMGLVGLDATRSASPSAAVKPGQ